MKYDVTESLDKFDPGRIVPHTTARGFPQACPSQYSPRNPLVDR